jgi:hypothetical protein
MQNEVDMLNFSNKKKFTAEEFEEIRIIISKEINIFKQNKNGNKL